MTQQMALVGVDVGSQTFEAAIQPPGKAVPQMVTFENTPEGRARFIARIQKHSGPAKVCLESTGVYSFDLTLELHNAPDIEVMVVNPHQMSKFRDAIAERNKSDRTDAEVALEFARRMDFKAWQAPAQEKVALRYLARRISDLVKQQTQEKNRLHAAEASQTLPALIQRDIREHIAELERRIADLRKAAIELMNGSEELKRCYELTKTVVGIADISAISILGELVVLPEGMKVKQWVAWAGLDPVIYESGTSVRKAAKISRRGSNHLRAALFMPAKTASTYEPHFKAFYQELLGRGKKPLQAFAAVMRKLLHALYGMLKNNQPFDGSKVRALPAA